MAEPAGDHVGDQVSVEIVATPEKVWAVVSDVTRMGEWSPVCRRCEWLEGWVGPEVGARFVGHNRQMGVRWSRECVITTFEPGRELAFETLFRGAPSTLWRYQLEPTESGTRVAESYEVLAMPQWVRAVRRVPGMRHRSQVQGRRGMQVTMERIKATAEAP
jgi:uncharacterized protein YndB with AHSA1/START domain